MEADSLKADNKKIWIRGQFVEVTDEVYAAYMKGDRKIRYFENDLKTGRTVKDKDGNINKPFQAEKILWTGLWKITHSSFLIAMRAWRIL